jgi:hypothetical protein
VPKFREPLVCTSPKQNVAELVHNDNTLGWHFMNSLHLVRTMRACSRLLLPSTASNVDLLMEAAGGRQILTLSAGDLKWKAVSPGRASAASRAATER